jgi:V/A-type H+-transporting ATPase subunit K
MRRRLAGIVVPIVGLVVLLMPALAMAQEEGGTEATGTAADWARPLGAALAISVSALSAAWAQSRIGAAGQGTLAERPEERIWIVTLTALPEVIVLLGFVLGLLIAG